MATTWYARLDKTGTKVLCARPARGMAIAAVAERHLGRFVEFPMGWAFDARGVWCLTRHARRGVERGRPPTFRRPPRGVLRRQGERGAGMVPNFPTPGAYPACAQCPRCDLIQTLDAQRLQVVVDPRLKTPAQHAADTAWYRRVMRRRDYDAVLREINTAMDQAEEAAQGSGQEAR